MADTIQTRALARAAIASSSTQALASELRVPEGTLLLWMSGRAQMPVNCFVKLVDVLAKLEKAGADVSPTESTGAPLVFTMGKLKARCSRCDGTEFEAVDPGSRVRLTSTLCCRGCAWPIVHGDLLVQLAKDLVLQSRAASAARARRQADLLARSPKLRALKGSD